jgi:1-deoxy-D-xylulose-5-phosphate reductoisomerase
MKRKYINIVIFGSTGTIGVNSLNVIKESSIHKVLAISAGRNIDLLITQIIEFKPKYVSVIEESSKIKLQEKFKDIKFFHGDDGLKTLAILSEADLIISAIVGFAGFIPTYYAIKANKRVALANKESLVAGGFLFSKKEIKNIIPIDSEHSAIHQILHNRDKSSIKKVILTASGGPFLNYSIEKMKDITKKDALNHPNWSMGDKITIDSSTMVNKTLEVIEAHYLFDLDYDKISVIIHPQSIIHSMVEFTDSSIIAQLANPDMKIPISQAIYDPKIENGNYESMDFSKIINFSFIPPDFERFPILYFAKLVIENPILGVVLNRANEVAVESFLNDEIKWCDIYKIIKKVIETFEIRDVKSIEELKEIDDEINLFTRALIPEFL